MTVRPCKKEDWDDIIRLSKESDIPFPDFKNTLAIMVVEKDDKIVAFGYLMKFVESVMVLSNLTNRDKVESLKLLNDKSIEEAKAFGISQVNVFAANESFKDILIKHFNYAPATGNALYLNID